MKKKVKTLSADATETVGHNIGASLRGGEVIELISDLGGGKTTLTRGIVRGAGSQDHVSSPTFTISNLYESKDFTIHHFDFYRLGEAGLMEHELEDIIGSTDSVVIVEWSDVVAHVLPDDRLTINFGTDGEDGRTLDLEFTEKLEYLVDKL